MKSFYHFLFVFAISLGVSAQDNAQTAHNEDAPYVKPKLVVGVVVDQMRYDYITRFWNKFGEDGFKELVGNGFNFKNHHFNYIPTYTGPGHTSVYTGSAPETHGIISNNWFNKFEDQTVYCAGDDSVEPVGTSSKAGKMSPHRMLTTTVADENRLHTQFRGKTIGISLKDRGAILPAGHTANAAYWFHGQDEGRWITSSYYMKELPTWVKQFNKSDKAKSYLKDWKPLYDINTYIESGSDSNEFEGGFKGKKTATFPYNLKKLSKKNGEYSLLKSVPFGNSLTVDFALAAIDGEGLGKDEDTDFLTVSFSSTDYVGHNFGVNSKEVEDTYLRLDQDLGRFLAALDEKVGKGNYTLFLTADHGGGDVAAYLESVGVPAGNFGTKDLTKAVEGFVKDKFGDDLLQNISNHQIFFDYKTLADNDINAEELENAVAHFVLQQENVNRVFTRTQLEATSYMTGIGAFVDHGFNQKRSGDVVYVVDPSFISSYKTGSTHGSPENFDTHTPLLFYGKGIKKGSTVIRSEVVDIAPTISALLGIAFPSGATGKPLGVVLEEYAK